MGILEKIQEMAAAKQIEQPVADEPVKVIVLHEVDEATCRKAGTLAAYGLTDRAISDALLLSQEQTAYARQSDAFKVSFSKQSSERAQRLIDLEEGWDALEERALSTVLETLKFNKDPRFALQAAFTANKANRRTPGANGRVIDATKAGNIIILTMNQGYIDKAKTGEGRAVIDVNAREIEARDIPKRSHDVLTPQKVTDLLVPGNSRRKATMADELEQQLAIAGVSFDLVEDNNE